MTYQEICKMIKETGFPFAYHHFAEGESPEPPFLIFLSSGENNFIQTEKLQKQRKKWRKF